MLPADRRARLAAATGVPADAEAVTVVVERGQDEYVLAVGETGGDVSRALVHVKEAYAEQGPAPSVPAGDLAALTRLERDGQLTATQAKQVLAELVADRGRGCRGDRRGQGLRGDGRNRRWTSLVDDAIRANPAAWDKFSRRRGEGDRRARRRRDEGVARSGRRRGRHGTAARTAQLSPPLSCAGRALSTVHVFPQAVQGNRVEPELGTRQAETGPSPVSSHLQRRRGRRRDVHRELDLMQRVVVRRNGVGVGVRRPASGPPRGSCDR